MGTLNETHKMYTDMKTIYKGMKWMKKVLSLKKTLAFNRLFSCFQESKGFFNFLYGEHWLTLAVQGRSPTIFLPFRTQLLQCLRKQECVVLHRGRPMLGMLSLDPSSSLYASSVFTSSILKGAIWSWKESTPLFFLISPLFYWILKNSYSTDFQGLLSTNSKNLEIS